MTAPIPRRALGLLVALPLAALMWAGGGDRAIASSHAGWSRFGYDASRANAAPRGIAASRVRELSTTRIALPGTVDSSPIYLRDVVVEGQRRDLLVMTTSYG